MTEQEKLMDDFEKDITKVLQDNRHKMYQRMSAEKPSKEALEVKYMIRYYDMKSDLKTKLLKPEDYISLIDLAQMFVRENGRSTTFWVYDSKRNLIYSQQ